MSSPANSSDPTSIPSYQAKKSWEIDEWYLNSDRKTFGLPFFAITSNNTEADENDDESDDDVSDADVVGWVNIHKESIIFEVGFPEEIDLDKIYVNAEYKLKTNDGEFEVVVQGQSDVEREESSECNRLKFRRIVTINADLLFDEGKSFILEADLVVQMKDAVKSQQPDIFVEEMKSIFFDEETSDVLVIAEGREFKCHKNVLSARSEVFKNTLSNDTLERNTNKIVINEVAAKTVEDMLKYLYSGEIPKNLTTELLHIADMHQLHPLIEACLKNLIESLDVPSCISTFILVDRYQPQNRNMREMVIEFIKCKTIEVVKEEDCDKLVDSHPALAKELVRAIGSKVEELNKEKHRCKFCVVTYK